MRHRPSRIEPVEDCPDVLDFPRDIQPILDRHCVSCHNADQLAGDVLLTGDHGPMFSHSYFELTRMTDAVMTDQEIRELPKVWCVGGDGALGDIGFQNLSRLMASGKPIKVFVVDTQVYSNTGGQACTSGFIGQVSDMAQFGKAIQGKQEPRKEIGLIGMAHRTTYVLQSTIAHSSHMIEGFIQGLKARRPALFNLYTSCQPEHGIGDDMSAHQAKLAVESRAYPLFRYNPDELQYIEPAELPLHPDGAGIGREIRVIARSREVDDARADLLATDLATRIQNEMDYPGKIKVTVIRETRATQTARQRA